MKRIQAFDVVVYALLLVVGLIMLYPVVHVFSISLSSERAIVQGISWFPKDIDLVSYKWILTHPMILKGYRNTILYTCVGAFINVTMTAITAYPLSRRRLIGRTFITFFIVLTMYFSGGLIPTYLLIRSLGLLDTIWALVLPPAISVWNLIILRTFFQNLPVELEEAAFLDGAGVLRTLFRVIMPVSKAAIATITLFYAVVHWNSYFAPLVYLRNINKLPIQIVVRDMVMRGNWARGSISATNPFRDELDDMDVFLLMDKLKYTALFVSILPMLCAYPFIQKCFAKGVMIGALKA